MWLESEVGVGTTFYFSLPLETPLPAALASSDAFIKWFSPYAEHEYRLRTRRSKAPAPTVVPRLVLLEKGETLRRLFDRYTSNVDVVSVESLDKAVKELNRSPAQLLIANAPPFDRKLAPVEQLASLPYRTPAVACW